MAKPIDLEKIMRGLPERRQVAIQKRVAEMQVELDNLNKIRREASITPQALAARMGVKQSFLPKCERDADLLISALRHCIEAVGGRIDVVVSLPGSDPIVLSGIGGLTGAP